MEYPEVHVDAYSMQQRIRVQKPTATRFGAGQLRVDVPIRNLTDDDLTIDYVYYFMDAKGIEIGEPQVARLRVQRKGIGQIEIASMSAVADFRVGDQGSRSNPRRQLLAHPFCDNMRAALHLECRSFFYVPVCRSVFVARSLDMPPLPAIVAAKVDAIEAEMKRIGMWCRQECCAA